MFKEAQKLIESATKITVVQAENPDGDSLGSSLALEEILSDLKKTVSLYCPVDIPKYLRYVKGWDRVLDEFDTTSDLIIIVDTTAEILLSKIFDNVGLRQFFEKTPILAIDHHLSEGTFSFSHTLLKQEASSTGEIIFNLATKAKWAISQQAAEDLLISIMSDSLGLTTQSVTPETYFIAGRLTELGANSSVIENNRHQLMKKSPEILQYKADLIKRIEYLVDGKLALIHIPWKDIEKYSDQYNPSVLVLDEMRLVENVEVAIAIKTYPDGKLTGKIRTNLPVASTIAGYFGGGGHDFAAGFRIYESFDKIIEELTTITENILGEQTKNGTEVF